MKIPVEATKDFSPIVVPNNFYNATAIEVRNNEGKFGEFLVISFEINDAEHKGKHLEGLCNLRLNKKTKLYQWLLKMGIELKEGDSIDTDIIIGKKCRILTDTIEKSDQTGAKFKQSIVKDIESL